MIDITNHFLRYREILMKLWNENFTSDFEFKHETDFAFNSIDEGLFDSLVIAKSFDNSVAPSSDGSYSEIIVEPSFPIDCYVNLSNQPFRNNWENITLDQSAGQFKFVGLFDWSKERKMKGEFILAKLFSSNPNSNYHGRDFLFKFDKVRIKKN